MSDGWSQPNGVVHFHNVRSFRRSMCAGSKRGERHPTGRTPRKQASKGSGGGASPPATGTTGVAATLPGRSGRLAIMGSVTAWNVSAPAWPNPSSRIASYYQKTAELSLRAPLALRAKRGNLVGVASRSGHGWNTAMGLPLMPAGIQTMIAMIVIMIKTQDIGGRQLTRAYGCLLKTNYCFIIVLLLLPNRSRGRIIPTSGYGIGQPSWPTQEFAVTRYILRGCHRCGGDLFLHDQYHRDDDWLCMQCGRYRHRPGRGQPPPATDTPPTRRRRCGGPGTPPDQGGASRLFGRLSFVTIPAHER